MSGDTAGHSHDHCCDPAGWTVSGLLAEIAEVGRGADGSYSRFSLDEADTRLRRWFIDHARAAGLEVGTDDDATIWAWWGQPGPDAVLTGSHLDSVPGGGAYDGPLGVVSSLVAVARLRAAGLAPSRPLAVVVMADEEGGRFGMPCLGARLATGELDPQTALALTDRGGVSLAEALQSAGHDPHRVGRSDLVTGACCFVELHVEQGRALADLDAPVAIATAVRPHGRWRARFVGEGNHAGTTVLADRHDPVVPLGATILAARSCASTAGAVATVGRVEVEPNGTNVIASAATAWLDCRAESEQTVRDVVEAVETVSRQAAAKEGCTVEWTRESWTPRTEFSGNLRARMAEVLGHEVPHLSTGAGHDAAVLAGHVPAAMLFVRNPTGASHTPAESASDEDCEAGAVALQAVLEDLLR